MRFAALKDDPRFQAVAIGMDGRAPVLDTGDADWMVLAPVGARLHPALRQHLLCQAIARPDVAVFYGDHVLQGDSPAADQLVLKPDFDRFLMTAEDYIGLPLMVRADAWAGLGGIRAEAAGAGSYDLLLRAVARGLAIARIPEVLAAGRFPQDCPADRRRVLAAALPPGRFDILPGRVPDSFRLCRRFDDYPQVTLVVPTMQGRAGGGGPEGPAAIGGLMESLCLTDWPADRLTLLVGDDCPDEGPYGLRDWPFALRRLDTRRPAGQAFNYAAKMNRLWRATESEHLVLMNDDLLVEDPGWLKALMTWSLESDVGGVGARLLYPDGRIQHAGMALGLFGLVAHCWLGQSAKEPSYQDWALLPRRWSAVTGAVFATRRSLLEMANGFDEGLALELNDVDLCLRLGTLGKAILMTPFAELIHFEKASRGAGNAGGAETARFLRRWEGLIDDDPCFHPGLSRGSFTLHPREPVWPWWRQGI